MTQDPQALKEAYYDYAAKLPAGLPVLLRLLQEQQYESLFQNLAHFAEGLEALYVIEQVLALKGEHATGRLHEGIAIFECMLPLMEAQAFEALQQPLEELCALFSSATEWSFER